MNSKDHDMNFDQDQNEINVEINAINSLQIHVNPNLEINLFGDSTPHISSNFVDSMENKTSGASKEEHLSKNPSDEVNVSENEIETNKIQYKGDLSMTVTDEELKENNVNPNESKLIENSDENVEEDCEMEDITLSNEAQPGSELDKHVESNEESHNQEDNDFKTELLNNMTSEAAVNNSGLSLLQSYDSEGDNDSDMDNEEDSPNTIHSNNKIFPKESDIQSSNININSTESKNIENSQNTIENTNNFKNSETDCNIVENSEIDCNTVNNTETPCNTIENTETPLNVEIINSESNTIKNIDNDNNTIQNINTDSNTVNNMDTDFGVTSISDSNIASDNTENKLCDQDNCHNENIENINTTTSDSIQNTAINTEMESSSNAAENPTVIMESIADVEIQIKKEVNWEVNETEVQFIEAKHKYRSQEVEIDSSSDSESDSSESSSDEIDSDNEEDPANEDNSVTENKKEESERKIQEPPKLKGEILTEDLPLLEKLTLTVEEDLVKPIGYVYNIIKNQVLVQALEGIPSINLDTVLFLNFGKDCIGKVFDVFGPVKEPMYIVLMNKEDQVNDTIQIGATVFYAPTTEHTSFLILDELMKIRGSDASWKGDVEVPPQFADYSDDEEERKAKQGNRKRKVKTEEVEVISDEEAPRAQKSNPFNRFGLKSRGGGPRPSGSRYNDQQHNNWNQMNRNYRHDAPGRNRPNFNPRQYQHQQPNYCSPRPFRPPTPNNNPAFNQSYQSRNNYNSRPHSRNQFGGPPLISTPPPFIATPPPHNQYNSPQFNMQSNHNSHNGPPIHNPNNPFNQKSQFPPVNTSIPPPPINAVNPPSQGFNQQNNIFSGPPPPMQRNPFNNPPPIQYNSHNQNNFGNPPFGGPPQFSNHNAPHNRETLYPPGDSDFISPPPSVSPFSGSNSSGNWPNRFSSNYPPNR